MSTSSAPPTDRHDLRPCPQCGHRLTDPEPGAPWCPVCEWNIGALEADPAVPRGWRWLDRRARRWAFRLDQEMFAELSVRRPGRMPTSAARLLLVAVSVVLLLVVIVLATVGTLLITHGGLAILGGAFLFLPAWGLRPRLGRLPRRRLRLGPDRAPALHAVVRRIAEAAGAPTPDVIAVDLAYNASTARVGLRQRSTLVIGIPLWLVLEPEQRIAVLAHEIGHQVNGDPTRGLLIRPALTTFQTLASYTRVDIRQSIYRGFAVRQSGAAAIIVLVAMKLVSSVCLLVHAVLTAVASRDHHHAEYLADGIALDVAGTSATVSALDRLLLLPDIATAVRAYAEIRAPGAWHSVAENIHTSRSDRLPQLRQHSMRETTLWDSHPPNGRRARLVEGWPAAEPKVTVSVEEWAAVHAELQGWYGMAHRQVLGTRQFREVPVPRQS